jgi:hypothetical protein
MTASVKAKDLIQSYGGARSNENITIYAAERKGSVVRYMLPDVYWVIDNITVRGGVQATLSIGGLTVGEGREFRGLNFPAFASYSGIGLYVENESDNWMMEPLELEIDSIAPTPAGESACRDHATGTAESNWAKGVHQDEAELGKPRTIDLDSDYFTNGEMLVGGAFTPGRRELALSEPVPIGRIDAWPEDPDAVITTYVRVPDLGEVKIASIDESRLTQYEKREFSNYGNGGLYLLILAEKRGFDGVKIRSTETSNFTVSYKKDTGRVCYNFPRGCEMYQLVFNKDYEAYYVHHGRQVRKVELRARDDGKFGMFINSIFCNQYSKVEFDGPVEFQPECEMYYLATNLRRRLANGVTYAWS